MAVTVTQDTVELTAQGDQFLLCTIPQSVRVVASAGSLAGDVVTISDPVTSGVLWSTSLSGPNTSEAELTTAGNRNGRTWQNGFEVSVNTGDRANVYVRYT